MTKKIPDETKDLIWKLYNQEGLSPAEISKITNLSYFTVRGYTLIRTKGFKSKHKYAEHLAEEKGFKSYNDYQNHLAKEKGFKSKHKYAEDLVKEKGFDSYNDYQNHLAKERQKRKINKKLSTLIKNSLNELNITQRDLSEQLGVAESSVSRYMKGFIMPKKSLQLKLFKLLQLPYKTIDDILK